MIPGQDKIQHNYTFIVLLMIIAVICVIIKAGYIMFAERQYWKDVANRLVNENVVVHPTRGNILSADGKLMASSLPEYKRYMDFLAGGKEKDSMLINHLTEICKGLNAIFPDKSVSEFRRDILKGRKAKSQHFRLYPKRISYIQYKEVKKLPVFRLSKNKGGLHVDTFNLRKKPFGTLAMRTLGDLYPDMSKGAKNGLELTYDSILRGKDGIIHRQKIMNKYLSITDKPAVDGCDIVTTIDVDVQDIAEKALVDQLKKLEANSGVAIVMEVKTGEVKANVNMTRGNDGNYYEMRNDAVSNLMEPGSTFKTASIMVALEDGYITPETMVDTKNGVVDMHGSKMRDHNWHRGGYGKIDVTRIVEVSSNVGVSSIIDKYYGKDPQKFVDGLKRMSIDKPLHLGFVGEASPRILGPKEREEREGALPWSKTSLPWMSIGYETMFPPIYILNFYNAIANNGTMVKPKFVKSIEKDGKTIKEFPTEIVNPHICSDKTLKQIQTILQKVVSEGLAKPAGSSQFNVSGKTGTAQVAQRTSGYKSGTVSYLVSFCGYFPSEHPQYSCIVSIQIPKGPASGGLQAGSVFSKIAERIYAKHLFKDLAEAKDSTAILVPDVKKGDMAEALTVLEDLDIKTNKPATADSKNAHIWGKASKQQDQIELSSIKIPAKSVPNVKGMGAKDAVFLVESCGLKARIIGTGTVKEQSISPGMPIHKGQTITLTLKH